ncbi:MAG: amino acid ABC transporter permease [Alphaproteobacteria bacterium]|nr:amino acid ABC transporter permease [Alphaproteobacteria bacterium]
MEAVAHWFRDLYATTGINLTIVYDAFDRSRFFSGVVVSLELVALSLTLSLAIGVAGAWLQGTQLKLLRLIVNGYIQIFRNTPSLIQLYFFYFALGPLITMRLPDGSSVPMVSNFSWAVICFSIYAGAFNIEILRAGIEAVPRATVEAAEALGYSRFNAYIHIVLPLALRICLPALNNNLINLIKTTTIAYAIAVPELLYVSNQIWSDAINVPEMMNVLLVTYVALVGLFVAGVTRLERALRVPGIGI